MNENRQTSPIKQICCCDKTTELSIWEKNCSICIKSSVLYKLPEDTQHILHFKKVVCGKLKHSNPARFIRLILILKCMTERQLSSFFKEPPENIFNCSDLQIIWPFLPFVATYASPICAALWIAAFDDVEALQTYHSTFYKRISNLYQSFYTIFKCGICYNNSDDPSTLPCGHTFCLSCLTSELNDTNTCAVCRAPYMRNLCVVNVDIANANELYNDYMHSFIKINRNFVDPFEYWLNTASYLSSGVVLYGIEHFSGQENEQGVHVTLQAAFECYKDVHKAILIHLIEIGHTGDIEIFYYMLDWKVDKNYEKTYKILYPCLKKLFTDGLLSKFLRLLSLMYMGTTTNLL